MEVKNDSMDNDTIRRCIEEKYQQHDLSSISTEQLIKNEAMTKSIGGRMAYPFKEEDDTFATTGIYAKWHDDGGETVLMDLGSLRNEVDVHEEERKLNKEPYSKKKRNKDKVSEFKPDDSSGVTNLKYELKSHKDFQSWINFLMD